jgi:phage-related protein
MGGKTVVYYVDREGGSPVLDVLAELGDAEKQKVLAYISLLEEKGESLRRPIADYIGDKIYELRPKTKRVLYFFLMRDHAVIVHIFSKRTDRVPDDDKRLAVARMHDFVGRYERGLVQLGGGA